MIFLFAVLGVFVERRMISRRLGPMMLMLLMMRKRTVIIFVHFFSNFLNFIEIFSIENIYFFEAIMHCNFISTRKKKFKMF